ncbi:MAG: GNAT family N-acetyltransferase [Alphaproteobacteria bacterium]|nr:GNAT family N-acetyltransferase [Alphaproteobacteria bacterium]
MQIKTFSSFNPKHAALYDQILDLTKPINYTYPEYTKWFMQKFIPGLQKKERMYIIAQDENNTLAGYVLIKNTEEEKKICTLFVNPKFRRQGLGKQLIEQTLKELGKHPLITVSSRNLSQLSGLLRQCGFHLSATKKGVYNSEDTEYYFNDKKADLIKDGLIPVLQQRMNQLRQK